MSWPGLRTSDSSRWGAEAHLAGSGGSRVVLEGGWRGCLTFGRGWPFLVTLVTSLCVAMPVW
ncbi:hypothetical protein E2C01_063904 [Portunus trituberculatus]|uniref:Uncharacterized protein n=1 Tax=Portunus trituberculatus TaxID=210409 RepID=A0A5B7HMC2_PORTR|nr:hypothetical protein [Portunus trituberculatus]